MNNLEQFLEAQQSAIEGMGLFTTVDIPEGAVFFEITGEIISEDECILREENDNNVYIFWNGDTYIDTVMTDKIKYINHNCDCCCEVVDNEDDRLYLKAIRGIKAGEELTIDYGYDEIYDMCNCPVCSDEK
ncbi:MAG: SET domain-containing protein [Ignavibacteriales bacterium]|nr:SET domain-containing protein [Ignavibacteriales bacterium]